MSDPQPTLRIDAVQGPDACLILLRGELDLEGCPGLEHALREAERTEARRIVLDLEQLTVIDSAGLGTLLNASRRSATNGKRLQMTRGTGHVADMFRLTALDRTLPFFRAAVPDSGFAPLAVAAGPPAVGRR
jgi:anti-sigma B factor antagonist